MTPGGPSSSHEYNHRVEMAGETPPSDYGSSAGKFNNAISDFASSYVRTELQKITRERDDALARSHVPKLRALLRAVDDERQAYEQDKEKLIRDLRDKLQLLGVEADIIEATLAELNSVAPKYLSIIPSASTLTIRPPTPFMSPVRDNYFSAVLGANIIYDAPPLATPVLDKESPSLPKDYCSSPTNINVSPGVGTSIDHQVQSQIVSGSSMVDRVAKRPSTEGEGGDGTTNEGKRRKLDDPKTPNRSQSDISRKIAFPNLETGERIFRHSERQGLFVIRCNQPTCQTGFFTDPPLAYNRALKHLQSHGETGPDGEELSNEYIFENFACEIEGLNLVSKYWIKEHLGLSPHTYVPGKSRSRTSQADGVSPRKRQDNDKNYTPSKKPRNPAVINESVEEVEAEKQPRRTPRSVVRPDYAEMVANKDPWNLLDMDSEKVTQRSTKEAQTIVKETDATSKSSRSASGSSRSRLPDSSKTSTPGPSIIRPKTTELSKYVDPHPNVDGYFLRLS
ncbi:hypothetical protein GGR53DRAFT_516917 [Hypoxylon sp. FL1150]|nr:hypothetical protein GGR53DRAFT_516917 [Hypoxylon sp. FL1150]